MEFKKENGKVLIESPCKYCGGVYATLHEGKGPHVAEVRCKECKRHNKWMSAAEMDIYECYQSDSPIDKIMVKILNAKSELATADKEGDWIEQRVARKKLSSLEEAAKGMEGYSAFTSYGS